MSMDSGMSNEGRLQNMMKAMHLQATSTIINTGGVGSGGRKVQLHAGADEHIPSTATVKDRDLASHLEEKVQED